MLKVISLSVGLAIAASVGASAQSNDTASGNWWLPMCAASSGINQARCLAYLEGFIGAHDMMVALGSRPVVCPPQGVNLGQAMRVVVKYMRDHPERMHMAFVTLVGPALFNAFPCRNETSPVAR